MNLLLWRLLFVFSAASNIPSQQTGHPQRQGYQSPFHRESLDICDPQCVPSDRYLSALSLSCQS